MGRTLEDIRASRPTIDRVRIEATTEEDIRRHAIEDGENPDAPLTGFVKRRPGQRGPGKRPAKVQVSLRLDAAAIEAWKATGPGWQGRLSEVVARAASKLKRTA